MARSGGTRPAPTPREEQLESTLMLDALDAPVLSRVPPPPPEAATEPGGKSQGRHDLILSHMPLVDSIARRVHGALPPHATVELRDLAQSGLLGLVTAERFYDPGATVPFSIYARYRIEGEILDSLRRHDPAPRKLRRWHKQVRAARHELAASLNREPTEEELCDRLMVSAAEMRSRNQELSRMSMAAARPRARGESQDPASGPDTNPHRICSQRQLRDLLDRVMERLPARHRQVIRLYYARHRTLKEIGAELGVHESRVSQMHRGALRAMSSRLKEWGICSTSDVSVS